MPSPINDPKLTFSLPPIQQGKIESARIRVENIIRSDLTTELHEILELYSELLLARAGLLEPSGPPDPGLEEAVVSLLYAAPRTEVKELHTVRGLLADKFGKEFALRASEDRDGKVSKKVLDRLRVEPPKTELVEAYLTTIAEAYGVDYPVGSRAAKEAAAAAAAAADDEEDDDDEPSGGQRLEVPLETGENGEELSKATPPRNLGPKSPVSVVPPKPSTDNMSPRLKLPGPPDLKPGAKMLKRDAAAKSAVGGPGGKIPDVDELSKRFAQLKR